MDSRSAHLKHPPALVVVMWGVVFFAPMQPAPLWAGQPILFSAPAGDTVTSNVLSLPPRPSVSLDFEDISPIPSPFNFNGPTLGAPPLSAGPMISPADPSQLRDS